MGCRSGGAVPRVAKHPAAASAFGQPVRDRGEGVLRLARGDADPRDHGRFACRHVRSWHQKRRRGQGEHRHGFLDHGAGGWSRAVAQRPVGHYRVEPPDRRAVRDRGQYHRVGSGSGFHHPFVRTRKRTGADRAGADGSGQRLRGVRACAGRVGRAPLEGPRARTGDGHDAGHHARASRPRNVRGDRDRTVVRHTSPQLSALGVARMAAEALGLFSDISDSAAGERFQPGMAWDQRKAIHRQWADGIAQATGHC